MARPYPLAVRSFVLLAAVLAVPAVARPVHGQQPPTLPDYGPSAAPASGPPAATPPNVADLERRVRELEATTQQMQAGAGRATVAFEQGQQGSQQTAPPGQSPGSGRMPPDSPDEGTAGGDGGDKAAEGKDGSDKDGKKKEDKKKDGDGKFVAGWKEVFWIQSADERFKLRITGQIQADLRDFENDEDRTDTTAFFLRRARFGLEATMFRYYEFRFLPDFGQVRAIVQDAYLNVHYIDEIQVEAGKFKQPFSYEQLIQDRFIPTLERSLIDQLVPARDVGAMLHGQKLLDDRFDYYFAVSNGEINGDTDVNNQKDVNARIALRPFGCPDCDPLVRYFQLGISGGTGVEHEPVAPNPIKTPATIPWLTFLSTVRADGPRTRYSPEVTYFYGPLGLGSQYFHYEQELRPLSSGPTYPFRTHLPADGFYVLGTYLLTGEERTTWSMPIKPLHPFNPCSPWCCTGAWEVIARVSRLDVDEKRLFAPGTARLADPTRSSHAATEMTVGFNWYLNEWVRVQFNWERDWFDDPVLLGFAGTPNSKTKYEDTLMTRFQIIF